MRDIPVFTTEFGVASLVLKEIPYTQTAYIHLRATTEPLALLDECVGFCRAVGVEKIYATGDNVPVCYPLYTEVVEMQAQKKDLEKSNLTLCLVQKETLELWRNYYNDRMADVPNAAWMDKSAAREVLKNGGGYFIQENDKTVGIGMVQGNVVMALASLVKGYGRQIVLALADLITDDVVRLEVASTNIPAVQLYKRLGFSAVGVKTTWYKIF